jgi:hypothetical protein
MSNLGLGGTVRNALQVDVGARGAYAVRTTLQRPGGNAGTIRDVAYSDYRRTIEHRTRIGGSAGASIRRNR